ncbi:MAG: rhomboid family intramembrane serine protease [Eubacteriales bacterium]|nr:rhomboid family intramembrane serine protease [Eubacteriales bacterium]
MNEDSNGFDVHYEVDGQPVYQPAEQTAPRRAPKMFSGKNTPLFILIGLNAVLFFVEIIMSGSFSPNVGTLVTLGAKVNGRIFYYNEYWRLLTCMFLHGGVLHLLCNMYALYNIGSLDIRFYGVPKFLTVYFLSGLMGSLFSYGFGAVNVASVGASGAVFGLFGATLFLYRSHPEIFRGGFIIRLIGVIVLNLVLGFAGGGIDNLAHIGGLVGGFGTALTVGLYKDNKPRPVRFLAASVLVILAAAAFYFGALHTKSFFGGVL